MRPPLFLYKLHPHISLYSVGVAAELVELGEAHVVLVWCAVGVGM